MALRTNTKIVKNRIRDFIKVSTSIDTESKDFHVIATEILQAFYQQGYDDTLKLYYRFKQYNAFEDWVRGLPSELDILCLYCGSAVEVVGNMLDETEEERNKFTEGQAENLLIKLCYRELKSAE